MMTETKLDERFPIGQCFINAFSSPFRLHHDRSSGDILLYIREDRPSKLLSKQSKIEAFFVKINLYRKKSLISSSYNLRIVLIANRMAALNKNN